jgi:far upstream element-binding protein
MLTPVQKEKNNSRRRDNGNHDNGNSNGNGNGNGYSHHQTPSYGASALPAQPAPAAAGPPAGGAAADPYAVYGGYQNYLAMWYASIAQQQQGGTGTQGPPGA